MEQMVKVYRKKQLSSPVLNDGTEGNLIIFTVIDWQDSQGNFRAKKMILETYRNTPYLDAVHYVQEMRETNQDKQILYRFDISMML